ncbi:hypothetical protein GGR56DRAFT_284768 [Xylariaceae sp. FL0804]|nr:hypothetical protein GGR56DRAFT_284768 [Xylariaceae sp. FL0804]
MSANPKSTRSRFSPAHAASSSPAPNSRAASAERGGAAASAVAAMAASAGGGVGGGGGGGGGASRSSRAFMRSWLEPPVSNKTSFQDAGLMRGGVVENMAPLGTLPKTSMLRKPLTAGEGSPAPSSSAGVVKRIVLKKHSAPATATPPESASMSSANSPEREDAAVGLARASPLSRPTTASAMVDDGEDEDDDYVPRRTGGRMRHSSGGARNRTHSSTPGTRRQSGRRRSARPSPAPNTFLQPVSAPVARLPAAPVSAPEPEPEPEPELELEPAPAPAPAPDLAHDPAPDPDPESGTPLSVQDHTAPLHFNAPPSVRTRAPDDKGLADKIVEYAVEQAIHHCRYPTAFAIRMLYDENADDPQFVSMLEDIYHQRADVEALQEFSRLIRAKKKDGRLDNKGEYYFSPETPGSHATPRKAMPAPYRSLVTMDLDTPFKEAGRAIDDDGHVSKKARVEAVEPPNGHATTATPDANGISELHHQHLEAQHEDDERDEAPGDAYTAQDPALTMSSSRQESHRKSHRKSHHKSPHKSPYKSPHKSSPHKSSPHKSSPHKGLHKSPHKSGKGRKQHRRSGSGSSESSLSSVPDDEIEDYHEYMDRVDGDLGVARPAEPSDAHMAAGLAPPISSRRHRKSAGKKNVSPNSSLPSHVAAPHLTRHHSRDSSMSAAGVANGSSAAPHFASRFPPLAQSNELVLQRRRSKHAENATITRRERSDSFIRAPLPGDLLPLPEPEPEPEDLTELAPPPPDRVRPSRASGLSSRAARAAKRNNEDLDDNISPTAPSFRAELEVLSTRNSRAATPANLRSSKKSRGGLRVKNSPMKKGTVAGISRGNGERPSPVSNGAPFGAPFDQDDNDDTCYSCGGGGKLACCDGCHYSFHHSCLDPPMDPNHDDDTQDHEFWYCNECRYRRFPPLEPEHKGVMRLLEAVLDKTNPAAFRLPEDARNTFESVRTGIEGEYEEPVPPKPKAGKKNVDEPYDFFKIRDANGAVLCHACTKSAQEPDHAIIPCSACGLYWHLDCLDPPLAVPPVLRTWRCPCHVEDLLDNMQGMGPAHRYRFLKDAPVIDQAYSRGIANNGWIEVVSDDENDDAQYRALMNYGRKFRLTAGGIKRDFIETVHRRRAAAEAFRASQTRTLDQEQAALNLRQFARGDNTGLNLLANTLAANAPIGVVHMMAQADAQRLASGDLVAADVGSLHAMLAGLDAMKRNITQALESQESATATAATIRAADPAAAPGPTPGPTPETNGAATVNNVFSTGSPNGTPHDASPIGNDGHSDGASVGTEATVADAGSSAMQID